jgi:hypothetical protein
MQPMFFFLLESVGGVGFFLILLFPMCSPTSSPKMLSITPQFILYMLCLKFYSCNLYNQSERRRLQYLYFGTVQSWITIMFHG